MLTSKYARRCLRRESLHGSQVLRDGAIVIQHNVEGMQELESVGILHGFRKFSDVVCI